MIAAIRKGITVLEAFTPADREWTIAGLSRHLDMPQPTVHHILKSFKERGWVAQDPATKRYRLGVHLWELGCVAVNYRELTEVLRPRLRALVAELNETAVVAMIAYEDPLNVVYIERVDGSHPVRAVQAIGTRLPSHLTAMGKAILAHNQGLLEAVLAHELSARTEASITDARALRCDLEKTRRRGYAISKGEARPDMSAVAAPIRDHAGIVQLAVGMGAPTYRMTDEFIEAIAPSVVATARDISTELGWRE